MNWWLFVQLIFLLFVVGIMVSFVIDSAIDKIYQNRDKNERNQRQNWRNVPAPESIIKGSSDS